MLHLRRYRIFVIFAILFLGALYRFTSLKTAGTRSVDNLKHWGGKGTSTSEQGEEDGNKYVDQPVILDTQAAMLDSPQATEMAASSTVASAPIPTEKPDIPVGRFGEFVMGGEGRHEPKAKPLADSPEIHWKSMPEHFPVPSESLIPLPAGRPHAIPKIQYAFKVEGAAAKAEREEKQAAVKEAFQHSWKGYMEKAWREDELSPVSGDFRNPFCSWGATLVDSLDTLWIVGMKEEFKEAVAAVGEIDFTTSPRKDIPLFETTIRYLGGLLAAYDLSEGQYDILLLKAEQLGEVLMGAFDTPNRMPMAYYFWRPTFAENPHRAGTRVAMSEIGSLSVEFTRLAQITKKAKYYDAIARITDEFEIWQNSTKIPGLWPKTVDTSGCRKPEVSEHKNNDIEDGSATSIKTSTETKATTKLDTRDAADPGDAGKVAADGDAAKSEKTKRASEGVHNQKRQIDNAAVIAAAKYQDQDGFQEPASLVEPSIAPEKIDCMPQGLQSPPGSSWEEFSIGGMADSTYEYLPKQYMLLGGLNSQYKSMYEKFIEAADKHLIYRPMLPGGRDVLILGGVEATDNRDVKMKIKFKPEHTHLTCFAGGMWGIGAQIFGRPDDLEIAKKLTDGCVWAYEATATGIMPEDMHLMPCQSRISCEWNETRWYEALDPYRETREAQYAIQKELKAKQSAAAKTAKTDIPVKPDTPAQVDAPTKPRTPAQADTPDNKDNPAKAPTKAKRQIGSVENDKIVPAIKSQPEFDDLLPAVTEVEENQYPTQEEYVKTKIMNENIPIGVPSITSRKYILRPEAIESVFIMYRITGDEIWRKKGWTMFESITNMTKAAYGYSAIGDVTDKESFQLDQMESFWTAETLKYFYLLFSPSTLISLDEYVLNTEAHPFKRPT